MLLQLKGKLTLDDNAARPVRKADAVSYADVVNGLCDMGYERHAAEDAVKKVFSVLENDEAFKNLSANDKEQSVFRRALMELA